MSTVNVPIVSFLKEVMRRRKCLPSQLAADLGVSHATVSRWLSGEDIPSTRSCRRLAEYSGVPLEKILSITGHLPGVAETEPPEWPEFREYAPPCTSSFSWNNPPPYCLIIPQNSYSMWTPFRGAGHIKDSPNRSDSKNKRANGPVYAYITVQLATCHSIRYCGMLLLETRRPS